MKLYYSEGSPFTRKVRIVLATALDPEMAARSRSKRTRIGPRLAQRGHRPCWLLNGGRLACSRGAHTDNDTDSARDAVEPAGASR